MSLKVYNTLGRKKELFEPLVPGEVKMYCCGPTVYGFLHVGNFRGPVFYNLVRNWLEHLGYQVTYVYNYTDVDDKILKRAEDEKRTPLEVANEFIREFESDFASLELRAHDHNPRVTEHMPEIVALIERLITRSKAYAVDGEVLYSVSSFPEYGKLSGRKTEDSQSGHRIEVDAKKRDPLDFALWKPAKPGEQSWTSPWGAGRPGWHIECSAMSHSLLGERIDIHGGGLDLTFPHHENEIAQSEGAFNHAPYARYWLHNNMFTFGGTKMSKSLGNILTLREFLKVYNGEIFKFLVLSVHYRSESEFSEETVHHAIKGLAKFYSALALCEEYLDGSSVETISPKAKDFQGLCLKAEETMALSLNDDFNTPEAFAGFYELIRSFNTQVRPGLKKEDTLLSKCCLFQTTFKRFGVLLGLFQKPAREFLVSLDDLLLRKANLNRGDIDKLVNDRWEAKLRKDFQSADALRVQLSELGINVQDTAAGSRWEVAK